jgi:hypothetical protein
MARGFSYPTEFRWMSVSQIPSSHPLHGANLRCARAKTHIGALKRSVSRFQREPLRTINYQSENFQYAGWPPPAPDTWSLIVSDVAVNLRAALDFITWQLAMKHLRDTGESRDPGRSTAFSITNDLRAFEAQRIRQLKDVLPAAIPEIESFQPYNKDDGLEASLLELLRELSNFTKHRALIRPRQNLRLTTPPGKGGFAGITIKDGKMVVYSGGGNNETPPEQPASVQVRIEISTVSPSDYDISVLDRIHQLIRFEMLPRFANFF